ncbi:MAG: hypothetical protein U9R15_05340, partial [Chloroflexota bacterium]|nr:hypothetical protein [Chloroflexota bacterium]
PSSAWARWSLTRRPWASGAVVRQGQEIPPGHIAVGVPIKVLTKTVNEEYKAQWIKFKKTYVDLARRYPEGWIPLEE